MKKKVFGMLMAFLLLTGIGFAEAADWKIIESRFGGTAGETLTTGDAASLSTDGNIYKADADDSDKRPCVGFIGKGGASGANVEVVTKGRLAGQSGFTVGANLYFSETAGELTNTAPTYAQPVGFSLSATEAYIDVQMKP